MSPTTFDRVEFAWPWLLLWGLALVVAYRRSSSSGISGAPLVGFDVKDSKERKSQYTINATGMIQTGYDRFKNKIFGVDTADGVKFVFPLKYVEEISKESRLSFSDSLNHDLLTEYTYMGGFKHLTLSVFKRDITPNLAKFIPLWVELIEGHLTDLLPNSQEWTPVNVYPKVLRQLGTLTARVMVDADTPHNENWQSLSTEYLDSGMSYAHDLKQWPALARPFVYRFMPQYTEVQRQFKNGRKVIVNAINTFDERESNGIPEPEPMTVLYHLSRKIKGTSAPVIEMHLKEQMNLASGAIHTTSAVLTQTIFELAARPSYIPELRKEIIEIQTRFGQLTKPALWEMHKMDSFVREVHRLHSPNLTTLQKRATEDATLKDGTFIPKGTKLEVPAFAIHRDSTVYENGTEFDGFRFYKMWQDEKDSGGRHHYVSVRKDMLVWGYGTTACPGRFMADIEIKLILSFILMNYEIKNPVGQPRHKHVHFENQVFADPVNPVLMRKLKRAEIGSDGHVATEPNVSS